MAQLAQLTNLTVEHLKDELRAHSLRVGGNKTVLVERLREHLEDPTVRPITERVRDLLQSGPAVAPVPGGRINYDQINFLALTVAHITEELELHHVRYPHGSSKPILVQRLREHLNQAQPPNHTEAVQHLLTTGTPPPRHRPPRQRRPRRDVSPPQRAVPRSSSDEAHIGGSGRFDALPGFDGESKPFLMKRNDNPYVHLSSGLLNIIAQDRDANISGSALEMAERLNELDLILPDRRHRLESADVISVERMTIPDLLVYAVIHNINVRYLLNIRSYSRMELTGTITLMVLCPQLKEAPPPRDVPKPLPKVKSNLVSDLLFLTGKTRPVHMPTMELKTSSPNLITQMFQYPINISSDEYMCLYDWAIYNQDILSNALRLLDVRPELINFLSREDKIFAFSRGYLLNTNFEKQLARYTFISKLPVQLQTLLFELYSVSQESNPSRALCNIPIHPLEQIINASYPYTVLANHVGMIIPASSENPERYYLSNIGSYVKVLERESLALPSMDDFIKMKESSANALLKQMSDKEIVNFTKAKPNHTSRAELIANIITLRNTSQFFIPVERKSINKETFLSHDVLDEKLFVIAYGTLSSYHCYEADEFLGAFDYNADRAFVFRKPDFQGNYTIPQVEQLGYLLKDYKETTALTDRINMGLAVNSAKNARDKRLVGVVTQWDQKNKDLMRKYLFDLFHAGMYMRRWRGPGTPYPLEQRTTNREALPDVAVSEALGLIKEDLDAMLPPMRVIARGVPVVTWQPNGPDISEDAISADPDPKHREPAKRRYGNLFEQVRAGEFCIRMASARFIGSGYYHLRLLFNEHISSFRPEQVDMIY